MRLMLVHWQRPMVVVAVVVALVALVVLTWWLFLGRDTAYQRDAAGVASGPYGAPQVLWCVAVLALLTFAGALMLPGWAVIFSVSSAFTVAWSVDAGSKDTTGLWVVGAIGVLVGTALGSWLVVHLTEKVNGSHLPGDR